MLVIRFFRTGKINQATFKIVVTDKRRSSTRGRFVEEVGFWNPVTKEKVLKGERIKYWISVGAKPSATVFNLLISEKIIQGKKIPVHKKKKMKEGEAEAEKTETPPAQAETPASPEPPKKEEPTPEPTPEPVSEEKPAASEEKPLVPEEKPVAPEVPEEKTPAPEEKPPAPEAPEEKEAAK